MSRGYRIYKHGVKPIQDKDLFYTVDDLRRDEASLSPEYQEHKNKKERRRRKRRKKNKR